MLLKGLLLIALVVAGGVLLRSPGARQQALRRLLLGLFVLAAAVSLIFPEVWTDLAHLLGVGRGTDLLLYCLLVAFIGYVATSYRRFRVMEAAITELARQAALSQAPPPGSDEGPRPPGASRSNGA